jgi:hypothetical protein
VCVLSWPLRWIIFRMFEGLRSLRLAVSKNPAHTMEMTKAPAMRAAFLAIGVLCLAHTSPGSSSPAVKRDKALEEINACRQKQSTRACSHLNQNIEVLVEACRAGDESVLPALFHFTYLVDFFDEALLSDPDGFLAAMAQLSPEEQRAVAYGIGSGAYRGRSRERFAAVRMLLTNVPQSSPNKESARLYLKGLETANAFLFNDYFPPGTFTNRGAEFQIRWYSSDLYALGEQPLWPPRSAGATIYRFTYLGSFHAPETVTFAVNADGTGQVRIVATSKMRDEIATDRTVPVTAARVSEFFKLLDRARFWDMPAQSDVRGFDGAEWILEGVQENKYHVVVRWCPASHRDSGQDFDFAAAALLLLDFAGEKHRGSC